jgi:Pyridoxamine 5'-phosphate oxidase
MNTGPMNQQEPVETTNLDRYGSPALPWSRSRDRLAADSPSPAVTFFLGTSGPDGRPHAAGVGALWLDGDLYFTSGPGTRKSRDLAANPACTVSARLNGIDLVLEGEAARVTERPTLELVAGRYRDGGWPAEVEGDALTAPYSAPSAGPPPWHLYRLAVRTVVGVATEEPFGATRWRFERRPGGS